MKSVNFLLSFRELSGHNQEPLEIRGNHEQLQLLSETVTHYVQTLLGQSLVPSPTKASAVPPDEVTPSTEDATPSQLYLQPRSLVTHDLVIGTLSTNAEHQTISLKATQLFDLVSALDDCAAELDVLPLSTPRQRPRIPVWASSAAVIVLMLGVSTATLQLTQQNSTSDREWVTSADQNEADPPVNPSTEGIASAPKGSSKTQPLPQTSSPSASHAPSAGPTPPANADRSDLKPSPKSRQTPPSTGASAPRQEAHTPSLSAQPPANNPALPNQPETQSQDPQTLPDRSPNRQETERQPVAIAPPPADSRELRTQASSPPPAAAPSSRPAAEPVPKTAADPSITSKQGADRFSGRSIPQRLGQPIPGNVAESEADVAVQSAHIQNIRQYLSQRWQVPAGLTQPLQYQLTVNANGSLKQVKPLDQVATNYLDQVPLPAVNQPFIAPLQPSQTAQVRIILRPDGIVQIFGEASGGKAP